MTKAAKAKSGPLPVPPAFKPGSGPLPVGTVSSGPRLFAGEEEDKPGGDPPGNSSPAVHGGELGIDDLIPDPEVWRALGITSMSLYRWTRDPALGFPPIIKIRKRNFRSRAALTAWCGLMVRRSAAQRATAKS
jgi:hypothetical protein